ncbi:MAG: family 10 glycosylhydrolase [Acidobacteria bacterium]|nr:family 10 glycosylhydrolase [Acidobacteriota bacterium]
MSPSVSRRVFLEMGIYAAVLPALLRAEDKAPVYIKDMGACRPASALANESSRHHWALLPYRTERFEGTMVMAGHNTAAPEIRLPIPYSGWYAISFGIRSYGDGPDFDTRLQVRLDSDSTFSLISHSEGRSDRIDNYFWKAARLDHNEIVIRQLTLQRVPENPDSEGNTSAGVWLAYVELLPLSGAEVRELQTDRSTSRNRRLFAHNDAWSYTYEFRPTEEADIRRELEAYRDTDFSRIYWEAGAGDRMYYPTRFGLMPSDDTTNDEFRVGDRLAAETWRIWHKKNIDPFRTALEHAHSMGLEFHATYRVAGFHFPVPENVWNKGGFYDHHPELRGTDRDGNRTPRLSYAYPEVRKEVIQFLTEMTGYPIDGLCLAYNRRPPLLEYEPPVVESFKAKYGVSPLSIDDRDRRWLKHRAEVLTEFMHEVRAVARHATEQHSSRPVEITAIVLGSEEENLYNGIDLRAWVQEGVVDTIVPYTSVAGLTSSSTSWTNPEAVKFFLEVVKGTHVKLALNLMPRRIAPEEYRKRAHMLYEMGLENLFFWDTNARDDFGPSWSVLRRLGHRDELAEWVQKGSATIEQPGQKLYKLGDWDLHYVTPG